VSNDRKVLFVVHAARPNALDVAREAARGLIKNGIKVLVAETDVANLGIDGIEHATNAAGCELVIVFGGDGTILRGVEIAREHNVPVLGVNLGHVGFLAEAEPEEIKTVIEVVVNKAWTVESRTALAITVQPETGDSWTTWALNEVVIERQSNENMANLLVSIDGHPLSQWNCDGLLCATPTGSTAYAFSAGGPVVWPEVEALLVVPVSAHALFNRPIVVSPKSLIEVQVISGPVIVSADGRRNKNVTDGAQVKVVRHPDSVQLARIHETPFTQRLVAKFELPIHGWRAK
jgi:NAD+ kinase